MRGDFDGQRLRGFQRRRLRDWHRGNSTRNGHRARNCDRPRRSDWRGSSARNGGGLWCGDGTRSLRHGLRRGPDSRLHGRGFWLRHRRRLGDGAGSLRDRLCDRPGRRLGGGHGLGLRHRHGSCNRLRCSHGAHRRLARLRHARLRHGHRTRHRHGHSDRHRRGRRRGEFLLDRREQRVAVNGLHEHLMVLRLLGVIAQIVAADQNRPRPRKPRQHLIAEREAVHRLHHHIGQQQVHATQRRRIFQRPVAVRRHADFIARHTFQNGEQRLDYAGVVIGQKDSHGSLDFERVAGAGYCCPSRSGSATAAWSCCL